MEAEGRTDASARDEKPAEDPGIIPAASSEYCSDLSIQYTRLVTKLGKYCEEQRRLTRKTCSSDSLSRIKFNVHRATLNPVNALAKKTGHP